MLTSDDVLREGDVNQRSVSAPHLSSATDQEARGSEHTSSQTRSPVGDGPGRVESPVSGRRSLSGAMIHPSALYKPPKRCDATGKHHVGLVYCCLAVTS